MAILLDGKKLAATMQAELAEEVAHFVRQQGRPPGLATVLVGDHPPSMTYVGNKQKACARVGMYTRNFHLPATIAQADLLQLVRSLNEESSIHGILVQLPLPKPLDEGAVIQAVSPLKDVDGFSPENLGLLLAGQPRFQPCTPLGIIQLLRRHDIAVAGKHVVIVGRSNIVGKPLAVMLLQKGAAADATVTVCHSRTPDLPALTRQADVVVVAIGQGHYLRADMVKKGAVVVDVGINRLADGKLVGDVAFAEVQEAASAITPVPGGVGPMTITMLLHNTWQAARLASARHIA